MIFFHDLESSDIQLLVIRHAALPQTISRFPCRILFIRHIMSLATTMNMF